MIRRAIVLLLLMAGVLVAVLTGRRLEEDARQVWLGQAAHDTQRITDICLFWLTTYQAQLRGAAALFHSSDEVNETELFDALDVIEGLETAIPLDVVAFAQPDDEGRWQVTLSTDFRGPLAVGSELGIPQITRALDMARRAPDRISMGVPVALDGRLLSPLTFAAPNGGIGGVVLTLVDLTALLDGLGDLHTPPGLHLSLNVGDVGGPIEAVAEIWGQPRPAGSVKEYVYSTDSGQVHWQFIWDVLETYRGGPDVQLARVVQIAGVAVVALAGIVILLLVQQNRRIQSQVAERTADLEASTREAQRANRSKSVFLANMSHEIRTPLNAITGFAEILEGHVTDGSGRQQLGGIREGAARLLEIIDGILDLSRMDSGQLEVSSAPTELARLLEQVARRAEVAAGRKGLAFQLEMPPDLPDGVVLDGQRLQQVLGQLLDNAVKFTAQGEVGLRVSSSCGETGVDLTFSVQDTGPGIPEQERQRIFEAFTQRDQQSINEYGGLGIGLTLSQRLVAAMGGELSLHSAEGEGSSFVVHLPAVEIVDGSDVAQRQDSVPADADAATAQDGELTDAVRERLPGLLTELEARRTRWEELRDTLTINDVDAFAEEVEELGANAGYGPVVAWSETVRGQVSSFDIDGMTVSMDRFPEIVDSVRDAIGF